MIFLDWQQHELKLPSPTINIPYTPPTPNKRRGHRQHCSNTIFSWPCFPSMLETAPDDPPPLEVMWNAHMPSSTRDQTKLWTQPKGDEYQTKFNPRTWSHTSRSLIYPVSSLDPPAGNRKCWTSSFKSSVFQPINRKVSVATVFVGLTGQLTSNQ